MKIDSAKTNFHGIFRERFRDPETPALWPVPVSRFGRDSLSATGIQVKCQSQERSLVVSSCFNEIELRLPAEPLNRPADAAEP